MVDRFDSWLEALQKRHLAELRQSEVNRGVRALSDDYVHRRHRLGSEALSGRGKRAAFAFFFAPLHFLVVRDVAQELHVAAAKPSRLLDLGCGTGPAGAAIGSLLEPRPFVVGIDRQGWPLQEAAFTYQHFRFRHRLVRADIRAPRITVGPGTLVAAAYTINETNNATRASLLDWFRDAAKAGASLLIVEPIAKGVAPWWSTWSSALQLLGATDDEWAFTAPLPYHLQQIDRAAGLDHSIRKARTLWLHRSAGNPV